MCKTDHKLQKKGDVVLIKEEDISCRQWKLGLVENYYL